MVQIERVIWANVFEEGDYSPDALYLVKWNSIPYNESTWETAETIKEQVGSYKPIEEFRARLNSTPLVRVTLTYCLHQS